MSSLRSRALVVASVLVAGAALCACAETKLREDPHFGEAFRQDAAAAIADPDAHYAGVPGPGSEGHRVDAAQERYVRGEVIQPAATATSTVVAGASGGNGGSGGGGGTPPPTAGQ